jgi:hypothetical protein
MMFAVFNILLFMFAVFNFPIFCFMFVIK